MWLASRRSSCLWIRDPSSSFRHYFLFLPGSLSRPTSFACTPKGNACTPSVKKEGSCRRGPLSVHGAPTWHLGPGNVYLWGSGGGSTRPWPRVAPAGPCPHCCPRLSWSLRIGAFPPRLLGQNRWESKFVLGSAGLYTLCSSWPVYDRWLIADSSGSSSRNSKDVGISRSAETSSDD